MATLQTAEDLLEQLRGASFEAAKRDLEVVQAFAAEQGVTEPLKQVTWLFACF
jgi:oligopeptidase A